MKVQLNTDHNIEGYEKLARTVESVVEEKLGRFGERITRVEVYLSDVNGPKGGPADKRCLLEARLSGLQPISVSDEAATPLQSVSGACEKMKSALDTTLGKLDRRAG